MKYFCCLPTQLLAWVAGGATNNILSPAQHYYCLRTHYLIWNKPQQLLSDLVFTHIYFQCLNYILYIDCKWHAARVSAVCTQCLNYVNDSVLRWSICASVMTACFFKSLNMCKLIFVLQNKNTFRNNHWLTFIILQIINV